ncbi:uncharacterized protein [Panulirus ornatus]|uniref:uncharacterized protein isoform X2 n=1 Tax=Panulirus ornatus TaxID=150431 RepID=UPI003A83FBF6
MMATSVPQKDDVERWNVEQVAAWLQQVELADCCEITLRKGIDGHSLLQLTEEDLVLWGRDVSIRNRKQILRLVMQIKNQQLVSTGRHMIDIQRTKNPSGYISQGGWQKQLNQQEVKNDVDTEESVTDSDDDDDFSEDDFDDDEEQESAGLPPQEISVFQMHAGHDGGVQGEEHGLYMTPRAVISTPNYPSPPTRGLPSLPTRSQPVSTSPNHSQPPHLTNRRYPTPQPTSDRPPQPIPPNFMPHNLQPPSRDVSLQGVTRSSSFPNHGSGIQHGGFSGTASRVHGPTDHAHHGPPSPDSSGHGSAPVLGLPKVSQMSESNLRQVGRQNITSPFIKPKQQQNPPQGSSPSSLVNRPPMPPPGSHSTTSPHSSRPVSPSMSGGQGGKDVFSMHHPPLSASSSLEGNNSAGRSPSLAKELQSKFTSHAQSASYAPEKTDHEYEIVDVPPRSYTSAENSGPNSSGLQSPDKMPPALPPRNQDGRETVNRQSQGSRAQQQPAPYNIGHNQLHGISVVNAKSHPVTSQGPPIITPKRPPAPLPGFQNQPPSSNVTHSRQHESSSDGLGFTQSRSTLSSGQGSPNLSSNRSPMPIPAFNISGSSAGSSLTAGHSSNQKTEHYPGPQHQPKSGDYLQFDEVPKEMAPSVPGAPSLPHIGETNPVQIKLHGGESIELLPLYRRIMDQPYFHMISRAKSKDILKTAMDGMFLIRPSTRSNDPLTLCLRHGGRTYNINIRHRRDGLFALGSEKSNEMIFSSVEEMIALHRREPIRLQNGKRAMLTESPPKFGHDYVEILNVSRN